MDLSFSVSPHTAASSAIQRKQILAQHVFSQLLPELRHRAFTVTGIESANALQTLREQISGLPAGKTWDSVKQELVDTMSPYLGEGAEPRATLLLRTHAFQAYQAENWKLAQEDADTTHLQYLTMEDDKVRDSHAALDGLVLPKDDPFWDRHYPPWEWNCRCRVRTMNEDAVADERQADQSRPPEGKLVLEGPALRRLREGFIIRPQFPTGVSVLPDERPGAFRFHPDNLLIRLGDLKVRYDAETWEAFEENAKATLIRPGLSLWNWLNSQPKTSLTRSDLARIDRQTIRLTQPATNEPAPVVFHHVHEALDWADAMMPPRRLALTDEERGALADNQRSSAQLNRDLVAGRETSLVQSRAPLIDSAMAKSRAPRPMTIWHRSSSVYWADTKSGDVLTTPAFLSASLAEGMKDFEGEYTLKINVPQGASVLYMDRIAGDADYDHEVEILLPRRCRLRVISFAKQAGRTYIEADLLP